MSQPDHFYLDSTADKTAPFDTVDISAVSGMDEAILKRFYHQDTLKAILSAVLAHIDDHLNRGLSLPYYTDMDAKEWRGKYKSLDVYITDKTEGRQLNQEARGKDYATNILSYPSALPAAVRDLMPTLALGELIICHDVVAYEAAEQHKAVAQHISHLLAHGVLHLLGFDHELGHAEQEEMEAFEIEILAALNLPNPYL